MGYQHAAQQVSVVAGARARLAVALLALMFGADLVAGLTAAAVVIPKAMAYATIAGLPLEVGLYTACLPLVVYAFLGTAATLSVSTTTTIAILSAAALGRWRRATRPRSAPPR